MIRLATFPARFALGSLGFTLALVADAAGGACRAIEKAAR